MKSIVIDLRVEIEKRSEPMLKFWVTDYFHTKAMISKIRAGASLE